jgi:hypothetical protein
MQTPTIFEARFVQFRLMVTNLLWWLLVPPESSSPELLAAK